VPGALACLGLVLQSLCDFFYPSSTLLVLPLWHGLFVCWWRSFIVIGTKVDIFSLTDAMIKKKVIMTYTYKFWASGPKWPPPQPPSCPFTLTKRVSVWLLRIQAAICPHSSHAKYCNTWRATRQTLVCARACTDHLLSAKIQPKPLPKHFFTSIMQLMHNAMRKLQVWNQLLLVCLNTPPRPTWGQSRVTRMAYSPRLWLMAIGWWNKINQCRKLKLNLTQSLGAFHAFLWTGTQTPPFN